MHNNSDNPTKRRLQAKLRVKRGEAPPPHLNKTKGHLNRAMQTLHQEERTAERSEQSSKVDVLDLLQEREISPSEREQIDIELSQAHLEISQVKRIKENFLDSVNSDLNFIRTACANLGKEREFFFDRNPSFQKEEAFASDILPHRHPLRKDFVNLVSPFAKAGISSMEGFYEKFVSEDPEDYKCIMRMYIGLCSLAEVNWEESETALSHLAFIARQGAISRKAKNLLSTLYDEGILQALETAQALYPYVEVMGRELKFPEFTTIVEKAHRIRGFVIARQAEIKRGPAISPALLEAIRVKIARRDQENIFSPEEERMMPRVTLSQYNQVASSSSQLDHEQEEVFIERMSNLKGQYLKPTDAEIRRQLKIDAKQRKKLAAASLIESGKAFDSRMGTGALEEQTPSAEVEREIIPVQIGGNFKTFEQLMDKTYKGSIEKVVLLFERLGGRVEDWHNGSRIKFSLPHFSIPNNASVLNILPPQNEDEEGTSQMQGASSSTEEAVFHAPHKHGSNKLRPYHVNDIRTMLLKAGYNKGTVVKRNPLMDTSHYAGSSESF